MNFKNIDWDHITRFSQIAAIVLFVGVFFLGFWLGQQYEIHAFQNAFAKNAYRLLPANSSTTTSLGQKPIADVTYQCDADKTIHAIYRSGEVQLLLSDGRNLTVPQAISGSGARYASADESFVFWNKGTTAFVTEGTGAKSATTYGNCVQKPIPE